MCNTPTCQEFYWVRIKSCVHRLEPSCLLLVHQTACPQVQVTDCFPVCAGWLITASNNLLNLWGCTCIGSPGEPALQLVHSLDTEFQVSDLQIDPANSLLMAAARDTKALTECVALHHLRMSPGIFRLKGRLGLPAGITGKLAKNTGNIKALQVSPWTSCIS